MGIKAHVAEVYQVKHRIYDNFSGKQDVINRLLYKECPDLNWQGEDVECAEQLEITRADLANLIAKICYNRRDFELWREENQISETLDDIIGIFAKWMAHSDQRNDFVVLNWY